MVVRGVDHIFDGWYDSSRRVGRIGRDGHVRGIVVLLSRGLLRSMVLIVKCRHHAFPALDLGFLHLHRTVYAVQLVV